VQLFGQTSSDDLVSSLATAVEMSFGSMATDITEIVERFGDEQSVGL